MSEVHGADGAPGGWAIVTVAAEGPPEPRAAFAPSLAPLVESGAVVAVDMPIGLPERITGPGRVAEQAVRPLLRARQSSVFSIPSRAAVFAGTYAEACARAVATSDPPRKVSRQAFQIFPKIREIDRLLTPERARRVVECHPEVAFWRLNGGRPMDTPKRVRGVPAREGLRSRIALLTQHGLAEGFFEGANGSGIPLVDLVDAAACALVARRVAAGEAVSFPDPPEVDARGLPVAIWA